MRASHWSHHRLARPGLAAVLLALVSCLAPWVGPSAADDRSEALQLVEKARFAVDNFAADPNMGAFRDLMRKARGVLIVPQLVKAGLIIGGSGGSGVLVARDDRNGTWSQPAFYTLGGASIGFQIGVEASEVVLLFMTDRGVTTLLTSSLKLGGDASVAAGPVGVGIGAETAVISADIVTFTRAKGLYGGVSLEGAVVAVRKGLNSAYYGSPASPVDILVRRSVTSPASTGLVEAVGKASTHR